MNPLAAGLILLLIVVIIVAVALISIQLERRFQARRRARAEAASMQSDQTTVGDSSDEFVSNLTTWMTTGIKDLQEKISFPGSIQELQQKLPLQKKQSDLPQQFLAWADQSLTDDRDIIVWLHALSTDGLQMLISRLSEFCTDMGFELSWLVEKQLAMSPKISSVASDIVLHYCRACYQAVSIHEDVSIIEIYLNLVKMPHSRENRMLSQQLYARLIEKGLSPGMPSDLALSNEKERRAYIIAMIVEAAEKTPTTFNQTLKEVVLTLSAPDASEIELANEGTHESLDGTGAPHHSKNGASAKGATVMDDTISNTIGNTDRSPA